MAAEHLVGALYTSDGKAIGPSPLIDDKAEAQLALWRLQLGHVWSYKIDLITQGLFGIPTRTYSTVQRWVTVRQEFVQGDELCYVSDVGLDHGQDYSYVFEVTAPSTAGSYAFQWQMLEEGYEGLVGPSTLLNIQVV